MPERISQFFGILKFKQIVREVNLDHLKKVHAFNGTAEEGRALILDFELSEFFFFLLKVILGLFANLVVGFYLYLNIAEKFLIFDLVTIVNEESLNSSINF